MVRSSSRIAASVTTTPKKKHTISKCQKKATSPITKRNKKKVPPEAIETTHSVSRFVKHSI